MKQAVIVGFRTVIAGLTRNPKMSVKQMINDLAGDCGSSPQ
jgi:hypothetical protein